MGCWRLLAAPDAGHQVDTVVIDGSANPVLRSVSHRQQAAGAAKPQVPISEAQALGQPQLAFVVIHHIVDQLCVALALLIAIDSE